MRKYGADNDVLTYDRSSNVTIPLGTWLDFMVKFKYGETDGQLVYYWKRYDEDTYHVIEAWEDEHVGYTNGVMEWRGAKFGIYRGEQDLEHAAYFDDVRMGNDSADVIQPHAPTAYRPLQPAGISLHEFDFRRQIMVSPNGAIVTPPYRLSGITGSALMPSGFFIVWDKQRDVQAAKKVSVR
jgi:hypothetical protein